MIFYDILCDVSTGKPDILIALVLHYNIYISKYIYIKYIYIHINIHIIYVNIYINNDYD
jgi:hypothetical protein